MATVAWSLMKLRKARVVAIRTAGVLSTPAGADSYAHRGVDQSDMVIWWKWR